MYELLDKSTIKFEILPHLLVVKRGYASKNNVVEYVMCILYKLKTGLFFCMSMRGEQGSFSCVPMLLDNLAHLKILKIRCVVAAVTLYAPINANLSIPTN